MRNKKEIRKKGEKRRGKERKGILTYFGPNIHTP